MRSILDYANLVEENNWTRAFKKALEENMDIIVPVGEYNISDTLVIKSNQSLIGENPNTTIHWVGGIDRNITMIQIGENNIGEEPEIANVHINFQNFRLIGHFGIGFGVYGTYLSDETYIEKISVEETLEHGIYFAKSWYATFRDLTSYNNSGCGLSLGSPLRWSNGEVTKFIASDALNMNNVLIQNIRANYSGKDKKYNRETNPYWGYGLGLGCGNAFHVENFLAENTDGVGVYCYLTNQQVHTLNNGYIEAISLNAKSEGRGLKSIAVLYDIQESCCKFIKLSNTYINEAENCGIVQHGCKSLTDSAILIDNVSYGDYIEEETIGVFNLNNCYYALAESRPFMKQGNPVNAAQGVLKNQSDGTIIPKALPIAFSSSVIRELYIIPLNKNYLQGQLTIKNLDNSESWIYLPQEVKVGELVKVTNLNWNTKSIELAADVPLDTELMYVIFEYTGNKATYI